MYDINTRAVSLILMKNTSITRGFHYNLSTKPNFDITYYWLAYIIVKRCFVQTTERNYINILGRKFLTTFRTVTKPVHELICGNVIYAIGILLLNSTTITENFNRKGTIFNSVH